MMMNASLRRRIEARWYSDKGAFLPLLVLSWPFALLSSLRRRFYKTGFFQSPELPLPVVVVGNINVGGTGKTPIVAWLAQQLISAGYRPGIVSRGYGAASAKRPKLVQSANTEEYGDEPVLLSALVGCPVCICVDRVAAVRRIAKEGVDIVISDDGLQHYRMRRIMEIVVVDAERGFGNGHLLPAGPLREPVNRAYEADALIINGQTSPLPGYIFWLKQLGMVNLGTGDQQPLSAFSGQRVWAVAGIGNPGRFTRQLVAAGLDVDEVTVPDHGSVSLKRLLETKDQPILMTEKDAVKYKVNSLPNIWYVPVSAVCSDEDAHELMGVLQMKLEQAKEFSGETV
jgi:tetraacyldisaccharide 4'-kinase